jgi:hypothetical protein
MGNRVGGGRRCDNEAEVVLIVKNRKCKENIVG